MAKKKSNAQSLNQANTEKRKPAVPETQKRTRGTAAHSQSRRTGLDSGSRLRGDKNTPTATSMTAAEIFRSSDPLKQIDKAKPSWLVKLEREEQRDFDRLREQRYRAEQVLAARCSEIMALPDVNGVHVGYRRKQCAIAYPLEICIRVHVFRKQTSASSGRIVTHFGQPIDGVPVDVEEGNFDLVEATSNRSTSGPPSISKEKQAPSTVFDPLVGGAAIANAADLGNWGSLGIPCRMNGEMVLLTNAHIAGPPKQSYPFIPEEFTPQDILHPPNRHGRKVAELASAYHLVRDQQMDAAVLMLKDTLASSKILQFGKVVLFGEAQLNQPTFIFGAASALNSKIGYVRSTRFAVDVRGFGTMTQQIRVVPANAGDQLLEGGDSGSVLLTVPPSNPRIFEVVGLVFAMSAADGSLIATPIGPIKERFGLELT